MVISPFKHRGLHVADQILEKGTYDDVDDLTNLDVYLTFQGGVHVVFLEVHAACDVFLSSCQI